MTATIEEKVRELTGEEIRAFVMPKPTRGQPITWYPDGRKLNGEMAYVLDVGRRNVVVQRISGTCVEGVYHIDDPKLNMSQDIRESGGWDFSEESKQRIADAKRLDGLEARLKALEDMFAEPGKSKK